MTGDMTLKQYADATRRAYVRENPGITLREMREQISDESYAVDYFADVENAIEAGAMFPASIWRTWPKSFRHDIFRNVGLRRSDALAAHYVGLLRP